MAITRLSGGNTPPDGSDPRTFPAIWNDAVDDIEALELPITAARIADGAVTAPKLADTAGAVMVFDDATARSTAIPTPVEGMVTYLKDVGGAQGLEVFDGAVFTPVAIEPDPPTISQVLSATKTDVFTMSSATYADIPGLSVTITPSSDSSKFVIFMNLNGGHAGANGNFQARLVRGATAIGVGTNVGNRTPAISSELDNNTATMQSMGFNFLDAPATGSAVTYTVQIRSNTGNLAVVNRQISDNDEANRPRGASSITVMEVAG